MPKCQYLQKAVKNIHVGIIVVDRVVQSEMTICKKDIVDVDVNFVRGY